LLGTNSAHSLQSSHSERWHSLSAFFDKNAGLSLVVASQFFFSGMNVCVKWLNSLDEPVPILELIWVRMIITYICSVAYMCVSLLNGATSFGFPDYYQVMARDSRPSSWSKGCTGVVSISRFCRVGYLDVSPWTLLRIISVSLALPGCISP